MNAAQVCHEVQNCPGLFVDAFKGQYLRKTRDHSNMFILTHYHGDHYQNLPRDEKYQGPALIHCTRVTARLLRKIHRVPDRFIVEHEYGQSFTYFIKGRENDAVRLTFYDANHCPGACIVCIELHDGSVHLHTGDMRYHEKFKTYPILEKAVAENRLDVVYLDTTYCHPKHDFVPQRQAIDDIARQTVDLLGASLRQTDSPPTKTLVLLSCYSIGKEKVIWEAAERTKQLVHVTEKKLQMLRCVGDNRAHETSSKLIQRCTLDSTKSSLHVIPMGLAGEIWPFFRPNFLKCAQYVEELQQGYTKVVAFLPTGWANASKWNREHAISQKLIPSKVEGREPIDVEVRLVPYSEHSTFSELVAFVEYLRPRKVIPTVFSSEAEYRKIENRFRNLLDSTRAKKVFLQAMKHDLPSSCGRMQTRSLNNCASKYSEHKQEANPHEVGIVLGEKGKHASSLSRNLQICDTSIRTLVGMGFTESDARRCLRVSEGNLQRTIEMLLSEGAGKKRKREDELKCATKGNSKAETRNVMKSSNRRITSFFQKKK